MEQYYEIVNMCKRSCWILLSAFCLTVWIRPFLCGRRNAFRVGAAYAGMMLLLLFMPYNISGRLAYALGSLAAFSAAWLADKQYARQKAFAVAVHYCLEKQAAEIIANLSFISLLAEDLLYIRTHAHGWRFLDTEEQWLLAYVIESIVYTALYFLMLYGGIRLMQRLYGRRREDISGFELAVLAAPIALCIAARKSGSYVSAYREEPWMTVVNGYDKYDWYEIYNIVLTLLSSAVLFLIVYVFRRWKDGQEEQKQQELLDRQMADMESHIAQAERLYREMRGLRHDMGNHLTTIRHLYNAGEYEAAGQYAEMLGRQIRETTAEVQSGNPVTDVILSDRKREMEEKGIVFDCDFHYPPGDSISAFDISIILHNALANAVEAVERMRNCEAADAVERMGDGETAAAGAAKTGSAQVFLTSRLVKNMFMIEVVNDYNGQLITDPLSGLPVTSKQGEGHGFGLSGIRRVAHRYLGDLEVFRTMCGDRERFGLRVMLQLQAAQDTADEPFTPDNGRLTAFPLNDADEEPK